MKNISAVILVLFLSVRPCVANAEVDPIVIPNEPEENYFRVVHPTVSPKGVLYKLYQAQVTVSQQITRLDQFEQVCRDLWPMAYQNARQKSLGWTHLCCAPLKDVTENIEYKDAKQKRSRAPVYAFYKYANRKGTDDPECSKTEDSRASFTFLVGCFNAVILPKTGAPPEGCN